MRMKNLKPLAGIRVVDFTMVLAGPYATRLMADLGADVVKVEPPTGDNSRIRAPLRDGASTYFGQLNFGKRSIALDLKDPEDKQVALDLIAQSDVVIENWRPGVADRLGLGAATLRERQPGLVYCSISGFGQNGPGAKRPAYAPIIHASSGFDKAVQECQPEGVPPSTTGIFIADVVAGLAAFGAIQAALVQRERTGEGDRVDVSLTDAMLNLMVYEVQDAQFPGSKRPVYPALKTQDGHIAVVAVTDVNFQSLAKAAGREDLIADERFAKAKARNQNFPALMEQIELWTSTLTSQECEAQLIAAGVPCSRYRSVAESIADPDVVARGSLCEVADRAGTFMATAAPFQFDGIQGGEMPRVPDLDEHAAEIRAQVKK